MNASVDTQTDFDTSLEDALLRAYESRLSKPQVGVQVGSSGSRALVLHQYSLHTASTTTSSRNQINVKPTVDGIVDIYGVPLSEAARSSRHQRSHRKALRAKPGAETSEDVSWDDQPHLPHHHALPSGNKRLLATKDASLLSSEDMMALEKQLYLKPELVDHMRLDSIVAMETMLKAKLTSRKKMMQESHSQQSSGAKDVALRLPKL